MTKRDEQSREAFVELVARAGLGERLLPWIARRLGVAPARRFTAREFLGLALADDPLGMRARTDASRSQLALVVPAAFAFARAVALVAVRAPERRYAARIPLPRREVDGDVWLDRCARDAVVQIAREQRDETRSSDHEFYATVAQRLGIDADRSRLACVALNRLPLEVRRAFVAIELDGTTFRRFVAEGYGPPRRVRERLHTARRALLDALERERALRARSMRDV